MDNLELVLADQKEGLTLYAPTTLIERLETKKIHLDSNLAQIVIGVRRSGKSTICEQALLSQDKPFGYINFDDERLKGFTLKDFDKMLQALYHINGDFDILFLDELQNVEGWELFVNRMLRQKMHVIVTGSNANMLSMELATHLTGRYNQIELYPYNFNEFCRIRKINTTSFSTKVLALREKALNEYLIKGGFPELTNINIDEHYSYINSLFKAIIEKDICRRYKVRYPEMLHRMADIILDEFCQEQSLNSIAEKCQIKSISTVMKYVEYLTNAYLLISLPRFTIKSSERRALCKYYAIDLSIVSAREGVLQTESYGLRLENAVAIHLQRRARSEFANLYYLKNDRNYEIDFVLVKNNRIAEMIQVTYDFREPSTKLYNREINNLVKAAKAFNCSENTLVLMYGETGDIVIDGITIHRIAATDYLLKH